MTDEAPVVTTWQTVEQDGVSLLVIRFAGDYGYGSLGNGDAHLMAEATDRALAASPDAQGVVFDATDLDYQWGDLIGSVRADGGMPTMWVPGAASLGGLTSFVTAELDGAPDEHLARSRGHALDVVAARCRGDYRMHDRDGHLALTSTLEPRGRRETFWDERRPTWASLWWRRKLIERSRHDAGGALDIVVLWPVVDAAGGESRACALGARLVHRQGVLTEIDFGHAQTERPLPADWLTTVRTAGPLAALGLDDTGVGDAEVAAALEAQPGLTRLSLCGVALGPAGFTALAAAAARELREVHLFRSPTPSAVIREFAREVSAVRVGFDGMYEPP